MVRIDRTLPGLPEMMGDIFESQGLRCWPGKGGTGCSERPSLQIGKIGGRSARSVFLPMSSLTSGGALRYHDWSAFRRARRAAQAQERLRWCQVSSLVARRPRHPRVFIAISERPEDRRAFVSGTERKLASNWRCAASLLIARGSAHLLHRFGLSHKKSPWASEQLGPEIARSRDLWINRRKRFFNTSLARFIFIDETSTNTKLTKRSGWCAKRHTYRTHAPFRSWKSQTFIAGHLTLHS